MNQCFLQKRLLVLDPWLCSRKAFCLVLLFLITVYGEIVFAATEKEKFEEIKEKITLVVKGGSGSYGLRRSIKKYIKAYPESENNDDLHVISAIFDLLREEPNKAKKWLNNLNTEHSDSYLLPYAQHALNKIDQLAQGRKNGSVNVAQARSTSRQIGRVLAFYYDPSMDPAPSYMSSIVPAIGTGIGTGNTGSSRASSIPKKPSPSDRSPQILESEPHDKKPSVPSHIKNKLNGFNSTIDRSKISQADAEYYQTIKPYLEQQKEVNEMASTCQGIDCYKHGEAALNKNELKLAQAYFRRFLRSNPPYQYSSYVERVLRTIRGKLPPTPKIRRDSYGQIVGSPEQDAFYRQNGIGKYKNDLFNIANYPIEWAELGLKLESLSKTRKNIFLKQKNGQYSAGQFESVLNDDLLPIYIDVGNAYWANIEKTPSSLEEFNKTVSLARETKNKFNDEIAALKIAENNVSKTFHQKVMLANNRQLGGKEQQYQKTYFNMHVDVEGVLGKIQELSWNPYGPSKFVDGLFPSIYKASSNQYLDKRITKAVNDAAKSQRNNFDSLPYDSEPKLYLKDTLAVVNNSSSVSEAIDRLTRNDNYYLEWKKFFWPNELLAALQKANDRRRARYQGSLEIGNNENNRVSYFGGLEIGESSYYESIDGYLSVVETNWATEHSKSSQAMDNMMLEAIDHFSGGKLNGKRVRIEFMGLFEDAYHIDLKKTNLSSDTESVCITYQAKINRDSLVTDCLYFKDQVLAGFSLDRSSHNCSSKCEYHWVDIGYFSGLGFKQVDEQIDGIRVWRKFERPEMKFNYRLWGGVREYVKTKHTSGIYGTQKAQLCVFQKKIEQSLKSNENEGNLTCT